MRYHVADGWQQFFPLLNLLWTWVYVAGRLWEDRIGTIRELRVRAKAGNLLDVEFVLLVAIVGFLPGEILSIHGGSAFYFSDVQRWVALAFILARMGIWMRKRRAMRESRALRSADRGWRAIRLSTVLTVFIAAPFAATLLLNTIYWPLKVWRTNIATRTALATKGGGGLITDPGPLGRGLKKADYYPLLSALRNIQKLPIADRRKSALFIPQSYDGYWKMWDSDDDRCTYVPFVAPAVSGVALIDGMPPPGCKVSSQYNLSRFTPRIRAQTKADVTNERLCERALAAGFKRVLVLAPDEKGALMRKTISCAG
jgi:hypothetical protein